MHRTKSYYHGFFKYGAISKSHPCEADVCSMCSFPFSNFPIFAAVLLEIRATSNINYIFGIFVRGGGGGGYQLCKFHWLELRSYFLMIFARLQGFLIETKRFNLLFLNFEDMPPDPLKGPIVARKFFWPPRFQNRVVSLPSEASTEEILGNERLLLVEYNSFKKEERRDLHIAYWQPITQLAILSRATRIFRASSNLVVITYCTIIRKRSPSLLCHLFCEPMRSMAV